MSSDETIRLSREEFFRPEIDSALAHQKALQRQSRPLVEMPISPLRRLLFSNLFYTPLAGLLGGLTAWLIIEPFYTDAEGGLPDFIVFPVVAVFIVLFIFISDGLASRKLLSNAKRWAINTGLTFLFAALAYVPVSFYFLLILILPDRPDVEANPNMTSISMSAAFIIGLIIIRSGSWAIICTALGLGMTAVQSTSAQRWASAMGGAVGGAVGGLFFDPIDRFLQRGTEEASLSRAVGMCAVGLCVGIFVALGERLGREGWIRVRTGPLTGKSFILYRNPSIIGSSPQSDIYLFKDVGIGPTHAAIHRVGGNYEIEDLGSGHETMVNQHPVRRQRLASADQITLGATILEFEERSRRRVNPQSGIRSTK